MSRTYHEPPPEGTLAFSKTDAGKATRRRGDVLQCAIFDAVFDQLNTVGYTGLTMEGVAAAAHTGKAALYRRWASKDDLVRDALRSALPAPADIPVGENVRDDLLALLRCLQAAYRVAHDVPFQAVKKEAAAGLHTVIRDQVTDPIRQLVLDALRRGAQRGEVRPEAVTAQVANVGHAMMIDYCLNKGLDVPDEYVISTVDNVLMPLLRP